MILNPKREFIVENSEDPRFSIMKSTPYDRSRTSMDCFKMCDECKKDYENPSDRRFHAQPIACRNCGPNTILEDLDKHKKVDDYAFGGGGGTIDKTQSHLLLDRQKEKLKSRDK
mgnify:CR=1 FL=1